MSFTRRLTLEDIRQTDRSDMAGHIAAMGSHIRESIGLANAALEHAAIPSDIRSVIIAGMGGSAIGGDLVRACLATTLKVPAIVSRAYELPQFADEHTLVIASSYSGNTEETLAQFEEAVSRKLNIICITTGGKLGARANELRLTTISQKGGMQPRAALGYSFVPILLILEKCGLATDAVASLEKVATILDALSSKFGTEHLSEENPAFALASQLTHRIPVIYSANDFEAASLRWRGQLQENAKHLAFSNVLSEMNHNELEGWGHPIDVIEHLFVILLRSIPDEHPRIAKRFDITKEMLAGKQVPVVEIHSEGPSRIERLMSLIAMADWTSYYLALFAGVDPTPIPVMTALKQRMG